MDLNDKLARDYQETASYFRCLVDSRLKLLALVPVVAGAALAVLAKDSSRTVLIPLSLLGFFVTLGILFIDQRNTEIYDNLLRRLKALEAALEFPPFLSSGHSFGGAYLDRPDRQSSLFGFRMWHDRGLGFIYSTALGARAYLFFYSVLSAALARRLAGSISIGLGTAVGTALMLGVKSFRAKSVEEEDEEIIDQARRVIEERRNASPPP